MANDLWRTDVGQARERLARLSPSDKVAIALHDFAGVAASDVVGFDYADGPNGVRGHQGATAFPSMLALAASFDRQLAAAYGTALAREVVAAGRNAVFSPGLDIARVPWGGRAGQQLGEDPFLAGEMGGVTGAAVQSQGVLAIATHYVANNFEWLRTGEGSLPRRTPAIDVRISARALHEVYLEPFRRALGRYGVAGFMGSYNRLNGEYVCQSADLLALPRERWGWSGVTVPDAVFAVRDPRAAVRAGLDLPALGDAGGRTEADLREIGDERLDQIVLHVLTAAEHVGLRRPAAATPEPPDGSAELARRIAADGMVLLRNESGVLPLARSARVAVIDAVGVRNVLVMGGAPSVFLQDARIQSVPEALGEALDAPDRVVSVEVGHGERPLPPLTAESAGAAIDAVVRDEVSGAKHRLRLPRFELDAPDGVGPDWSATIRTTFRASRTGTHILTAEFAGSLTLYADEQPLTTGFREASPMIAGPEYPLHAVLDLDVDQDVEIRVEYATSVAISIPGMPVGPHLRLGVAGPDDRLDRAAALAADCDVAVVLAGRVSGEAMDVDSLLLPGEQSAVLDAVAAANPRTVLVTLGAGPVVLPRLDNLAAVLHAWFPGEQFAPALAAVLTGESEPGGRLPITFPADEHGTPIAAASQYPGVDGVATYSEDLLVGHRWYDDRRITPAFAFGHGLGYTTFEVGRLDAQDAGDSVRLTVELTNTGTRAGKAVPQIYVRHPSDAGEPPAQLKGFAALRLDAGETRRTTIEIARDDLMVFDEPSGRRVLVPGEYEFRAALSSRDVRASVRVPIVG